jgi:hypothetical protein
MPILNHIATAPVLLWHEFVQQFGLCWFFDHPRHILGDQGKKALAFAQLPHPSAGISWPDIG